MSDNNQQSKAYVTVLTSESYLLGCVALAKSLKLVESKYPLVVLCPDNVDVSVLNRLSNYGIQYMTMENLSKNVLSKDNLVGYWKNTLFKIKVFDMLCYEKIIFLDTDMIVLKNLDHMFECEHMSAVAAGAVLFPDWKTGINSGFMVIKPNHDVYLKLLECIEPAYEYRIQNGLGFGDQDIIKMCYDSWSECEHLHLHEQYNTMLGYGGCLKSAGLIKSFDDIFVYHFTGKEKPWNKGIRNNVVILLKILKRAKFNSYIDLMAYKKFRKILKSII